MPITGFDALRRHIEGRPPVTLVVAGVATPAVLESLVLEAEAGLLKRVIVPGSDEAEAAVAAAGGDPALFSVHRCEPDQAALAALAVAVARDGEADVLMKGHIDSAVLLRQVLHKETGIRARELLSNITVFDEPRYHKLLGVTDNGIVPAPDVGQKLQIISNALPLFEALGVAPVKVALVGASEKVMPALPSTVDADAIKSRVQDHAELAERCVVDGPFGYDVCMSREAAGSKGLDGSPVAGDPDLLLFHDIEAANAVGKAIKFHGDADSGGLLLGARVPILFNSRSDGAQRRRNSLLLASAMVADKM